MTETTPFSADFPAVDEADWQELVEKALKGRDVSSLTSRTEHGVPVRPLYRESDWPSASDPSGLPGLQPFARGGTATRDQWLPWDIRQMVRHPDPDVAHAEILEALGHGASSIELRIDTAGEQGVCIRRGVELARVLDEVRLDLAPIALELVGEAAGYGLEMAAMLASATEPEKREGALFAFNIDPIGALARTGALADSADEVLARTGEAVVGLAAGFPAASVWRVDSRAVHEAGGTEVQELAYLAATGAAYMKAGMGAGLSAKEASEQLLFTVAVGSDYHLEIAKLRAVRRIWARIAEAFGAEGGARVQAVTSRRMLTRRDPWTNLLRNTAACFAAGVGGADVVTVRTFTDAMGHAGPLARRLARNTQIIAQEESGLGKVMDPAGGSWAFERLCEDMAQGGWQLFQEIEKEGGIIASLLGGGFQTGVADARRARRAAVARRKEWLTGVSDFPLLGEEVPECAAVDRDDVLAKAPPAAGIEITDRSLDGLIAAAAAGANLAELAGPEGDGIECDPLWAIRLATPYEALRDLADEKRRKGAPPRVFLLALGPLAEHSARLTFATNFFAAGGIEVVVGHGTGAEIADAFRSSACTLACICGADARYVDEASEAAGSLRAAGAGRIYLAGRGGEIEADLRSAGIDEFIHVGVDVIASLELAHAEIGLA